MKRAFSIEVLECDKCGGRLELVSCVLDAESITAIMKSMNLVEVDPHLSPTRASPEPESNPLPSDEICRMNHG